MSNAAAAIRAVVRGRVQGVGFRDATVRRARALGALGWVRNADDGAVLVHAEGDPAAVEALVEFLREGPRAARVDAVDVEPARVEGHEQFAVRGVPAGRFVVWERPGGRPRFELRLEVAGGARAWALAREPSLDPAQRRMAIELATAGPGELAPDDASAGATATCEARRWDGGLYEQGGRVPWPAALERGHAVFVLRGERLRGGFALQRTRGAGEGAQWLLVKRRDDHARRGGADDEGGPGR